MWADQSGFSVSHISSIARLSSMFLCLTFAPLPSPCPRLSFACSSQEILSFSLSSSPHLFPLLFSWISFLCVFSSISLVKSSCLLRAMWPGLCSLRRAAVELQSRKFCGFLRLSVSRLRVTEGLWRSTGSNLRLARVAFDSSTAVSAHKRFGSACLGLCLILTWRQRHWLKGNFHPCIPSVSSNLFHGCEQVLFVFSHSSSTIIDLSRSLFTPGDCQITCSESRVLSHPGDESRRPPHSAFVSRASPNIYPPTPRFHFYEFPRLLN